MKCNTTYGVLLAEKEGDPWATDSDGRVTNPRATTQHAKSYISENGLNPGRGDYTATNNSDK